MSKPWVHARSSVRKFGGIPENYIDIHNWFDETKAFIPDNRHRFLRHHSEGIFLCESIFGTFITNSDGKQVSVRSIGEQHCMEDYGGFIPSVSDFANELNYQPWMHGKGLPPSMDKMKKEKQLQND